MESKTDYSFIDFAKLGRTDWRATALTILILVCVNIVSTFGVLLFAGWSAYIDHFNAASAAGLITGLGSPLCVVGFWIACKTALRRPFRSLISADLTFSVRRCLFGAALFLPVNVLAIIAMTLYASMRYDEWMNPFGQFRVPNGGEIFAAASAILAIPFLAFAEELFFRGWLTQTLRQYVRIRFVIVAIVALAFAAYHTQYSFHMKALLFASSFWFSALSLRDQRLELAVGAHSMLNICVALELLFFTGVPHAQSSAAVTTFDWMFLVALKGMLPFALMYWLLQKTNGWFTPNRVARVSDIQRV